MYKKIIEPTELARRTKESARTVSLRIKERTWLGFEQLAKDNGTTANALISELADYYIENLKDDGLNLSDSAVRLNKFKNAIEKNVKRLCRISVGEVINEACYEYATWRIEEMLSADKPTPTYLHCLTNAFEELSTTTNNRRKDFDSDFVEVLNPDFKLQICIDDKTTIYPTLGHEASYQPHGNDISDCFQDILYVPIDKVSDVIRLFELAKQNAKNNRIHIEYDDIDTLDEIAKIINHHDYRCQEMEMGDTVDLMWNPTERRAMLNELAQIIIRVAEVI